MTALHCRHHPTCPGCSLMGRTYDDQLAKKRLRLHRAFRHFPHLPDPPEVLGALHTDSYRHRLKLPLHFGRDGVRIGLYDRNERGRVLDTPDCPVLAEGLRQALPPLLQWLRGKPGVHSLDLRVSAATGKLMAVLACDNGVFPGGKHGARECMRAVPGLASVAVSRADKYRKRVMGSKPVVLAGVGALDEAIGDTHYDLLPGSFFQVDPRNARQLQRLVREAVGDAKRVLDLYSGVGAYALMLAEGCERVVAVEEVPQAAEAARRRAPDNVEVLTSRVEDAKLSEPMDCVVLNPARRGSDPESLARIAKLAPRLVYISCGPETLARDLDVLAHHGMRVTRVQPIDLFPQTEEVETVVTLERGKAHATWSVPGGKARGPWGRGDSGAVGTPRQALALVLGETRAQGSLGATRFQRVGGVAGHSLVRLFVDDGDLSGALKRLAGRGHATAGRDRKTQAFFAEKAGLQRPFVHVERAGAATAPLHGDLVLALRALGARQKQLNQWLDLDAAPTAGRPKKGGRGGAGRGKSSHRKGGKRR